MGERGYGMGSTDGKLEEKGFDGDLVGVGWCIEVSVVGGLGGDLVGEFGRFWEDEVSSWWMRIGVSECGKVLKFKLKSRSEMKESTWYVCIRSCSPLHCSS